MVLNRSTRHLKNKLWKQILFCLSLWCFSLVNQYHSCQFLGFLFCIIYMIFSSIYPIYGTHFRYNGWLPVQVKYR